MEENIITHLDLELRSIIPNATEVYIAVALCSSYGTELLSLANAHADTKLVIGVDLPTSVEVLKSLRKKYGNNARIFRKDFFHPKVYLFKFSSGDYVGYISSGNFTKGGMEQNVEITSRITSQSDCLILKDWFLKIFNSSEFITDTFLNSYKVYQAKWNVKEKEREDEFKGMKRNFHVNSAALKEALISLRKSSDYSQICKDRQQVIKDLKHSLDYENNFASVDIDGFLKIYELGKIRLSYVDDLCKSVKGKKPFQKLAHMLCDESISIEKRFLLAQTEYHVRGCGKNIITKILVMHNPQKYMLWNNVTDDFIKNYFFTFEKGMNDGAKYQLLCSYFKALCDEADIKDFSVLDELLYDAMK